MTADQLGERIAERHKNVEDATLRDITDLAEKQTLKVIDDMWNHYLANWGPAYAPKPSFFIQYLKGQQAYDDGSRVLGSWICADCETRYAPLTVTECPRCGSRDTKGIGDQAHPKFVMVEEPPESDEKIDMPDFWTTVLAKMEVNNEYHDTRTVSGTAAGNDGPDSNVDADFFF